MSEAERKPRLMVVDDDLMSREVIGLLGEEAGYEVQLAESGQRALEWVADARADSLPEIFLADMQMPGISGDTFAQLLRGACPRTTRIVAMSGTDVPWSRRSRFDGFLLKPFTVQDLRRALHEEGPQPLSASSQAPPMLDEDIFRSLAKTLDPAQLRKLYAMCLDDAESRIGTMRQAAVAGDGEAYVRAAHSIKGGCGMVGAGELAGLAADMEKNGLDPVGNMASLQHFLEALARLRRMLDAQTL